MASFLDPTWYVTIKVATGAECSSRVKMRRLFDSRRYSSIPPDAFINLNPGSFFLFFGDTARYWSRYRQNSVSYFSFYLMLHETYWWVTYLCISILQGGTRTYMYARKVLSTVLQKILQIGLFCSPWPSLQIEAIYRFFLQGAKYFFRKTNTKLYPPL